jgi:hypothetical protein
MNPLEFYIHVFSCNDAYMTIVISKWPMKKIMNVLVELYFMMYDVIIIDIFNATHNIQLGYDKIMLIWLHIYTIW